MLATIFVSHSKYDKDIINFINNAFATSKVEAKYMEFENIPEYPGRYIANEVRNSSALFVLLGYNITRNLYTSNWIAYEVGLAKASNIPIWIIETFDSNLSNFIKFPIPYCDYLFLYKLHDDKYVKYLRNVIIKYYEGILKPLFPHYQEWLNITCPYNNCRSQFILCNHTNILHCPVCRQRVSINQPRIVI